MPSPARELPDELYDLGHAWVEGDELLGMGPLDPAAQAAFDDLSLRLDLYDLQ